MIVTRLFRRAAARHRVRRMRGKTATARRVIAQTDAMLARRHDHHDQRST